mmetsp:Transcript_73410/g.129531  ORF Transcript_73410/g.129531 Transcript_73410/m.129531 type:complete len:301 (+) Transcript_73410:1434-2336(+)
MTSSSPVTALLRLVKDFAKSEPFEAGVAASLSARLPKSSSQLSDCSAALSCNGATPFDGFRLCRSCSKSFSTAAVLSAMVVGSSLLILLSFRNTSSMWAAFLFARTFSWRSSQVRSETGISLDWPLSPLAATKAFMANLSCAALSLIRCKSIKDSTLALVPSPSRKHFCLMAVMSTMFTVSRPETPSTFTAHMGTACLSSSAKRRRFSRRKATFFFGSRAACSLFRAKRFSASNCRRSSSRFCRSRSSCLDFKLSMRRPRVISSNLPVTFSMSFRKTSARTSTLSILSADVSCRSCLPGD